MKLKMLLSALFFVAGSAAYAGQNVDIVKEEAMPLCHIMAHHAAPSLLDAAIKGAIEQSKAQCGKDSNFVSQAISVTTLQDGCGSVVATVKGSCYKP